MSFQPDVDDTAKLHREAGGAPRPGGGTPDDTDRMWITRGASLEGTTGQWQVHAFAQGIIRFYRARSILQNARDVASCQRAWRYLERLEPDELPETARAPFFELTYCLRSQSRKRAFESGEFPRRVFDVARLIDGFVDDLNREIDF